MSIFGSPIKEPTNFDTTKFFKTFKKMNGYNIMYGTKVVIKDNDWELDYLLSGTASYKDNKPKVKALEKLVETGTVVNRKDDKEVVLDAEFMKNVVEPVAYALLNQDKDLSKQILKALYNSLGVCEDVDFYNSLTDEEAKLMVVRSLEKCGSDKADTVLDSAKELVLNSKLATLEDISIAFRHKFRDNNASSKEEIAVIWGKLKPRLMDLITKDIYKDHTRIAPNGVKYVHLQNRSCGLQPFPAESKLLEQILHYVKGFVPEFADFIEDVVAYDSGRHEYYEIWRPARDQHYWNYGEITYINRAFVESVDDAIQFKLSAAMEKDTVKKLQVEKDGLNKQFDAEIQAIKDFVAARKVRIQKLKSDKKEVEDKLKAIEEENKRKETERAKAELQKKQAEFEALAAQLGVDPADLLALQQKKQNAAMSPNQKQY